MTTILTVAGDHLDDLIARHYGAAVMSAALDAVLFANIGLSAHGPTLPAGLRIVLPDIAPRTPAVRLWD